MAMAQDSTGPLAIKVFREMGVQKVWDPKKIHLVIDHSFPAPDEKVANLHILIREFVKQQGVRLVEGSISHQHLLENHVVPGMVLFGADSHTCQAGAIGAFATGIGSSEMAAVWASGKLWVRVPESIKINLIGQFKKGVYARDIITHFIGMVGEDGGNYKSLEWKGPGVKNLSIASRACISNNSMECGCKLSIFEVDPVTQDYFKSANQDGLVETFLESGAVFTNATCGACVGTHLGVLGENETCLSTSPRNYVGRMGATTAKIYLSSPATAAASALEGHIADPRRYL